MGSEGNWRSGRGPRDWRPFSLGVPVAEKVETILSWLDEPDAARRPRLITSWFPGADHAGHLHGPGSEQARELLGLQEPALRSLIEGIGTRDLWSSTTLIVVSDHGMVAAEKLLDFDKVLNDSGVPAWVTGIGGFASVYLKPGPTGQSTGVAEEADPRSDLELASVRRVVALADQHGLLAIPRTGPGSRPESGNRRFGDLVIHSPIGTAIHRKGLPSGGFHGYDSEDVAMHGIFFAQGRGVEPGLRIPPVRGIDVAPTILQLLESEIPTWMEGKPIGLRTTAPVADSAP